MAYVGIWERSSAVEIYMPNRRYSIYEGTAYKRIRHRNHQKHSETKKQRAEKQAHHVNECVQNKEMQKKNPVS